MPATMSYSAVQQCLKQALAGVLTAKMNIKARVKRCERQLKSPRHVQVLENVLDCHRFASVNGNSSTVAYSARNYSDL